MILMIDNYDSFVFNLVQYLGEMGHELVVRRNDEVTVEEIERMNPRVIVISPGPCTPNEAGVSLDVIRRFAGQIPLFGVCLGHQSIAQAFGGTVIRAERLMHGKTSKVFHDGRSVFQDVPSPFTACRYHSLLVERESFPECLEITAWTEEGEIMALRHRELAVEGVQFHPEAILTEHGKQLLQNFLERQGLACTSV